eukprot:TRINITY_DN16210_c0_g1_i1.p1 TRINITY_DN16210_c0_g1~~TRINITY_DN16210_c0_g1_i1.p1  ORF type:complete len:348 (+),score=15.44 TRINITY_DN16210_c0_g1_i1:49-1044(+)
MATDSVHDLRSRKPRAGSEAQTSAASAGSGSDNACTADAVATAPNGKSAACSANAPSAGDQRLPWIGIPLKWFVLAFLVFQNSFAVLVMRRARASTGPLEWNPQTGVIMQEILKAVACLALLARDGQLHAAFENRWEFAKAAIPAVLYLVQNNMQYVALDYLTAPTYAVLYQLKILSTAICSVLLLGKKLGSQQWAALVVLTGGVSCVAVSQMSPSSRGESGASGSVLTGIGAVLLAASMSGLAGASIESILQSKSGHIWVRSFQLTFHSIVAGVLVLLCGHDRDAITVHIALSRRWDLDCDSHQVRRQHHEEFLAEPCHSVDSSDFLLAV